MRHKERRSPDAGEVHPLEEHRELLLGEFERGRVGTRPFAFTALQTLVPDRQSRRIPDHRLHAIGALSPEEKPVLPMGLARNVSMMIAHRPEKLRLLSTGATAMKMRVSGSSFSIEASRAPASPGAGHRDRSQETETGRYPRTAAGSPLRRPAPSRSAQKRVAPTGV